MRWFWIDVIEKIEQDRKQRLKCRCGMHVYKWSWRHLRRECVYCKKKKKDEQGDMIKIKPYTISIIVIIIH